MTIAYGVGARITGARVASGKLNRFRIATLERIRAEAQDHANQAAANLSQAVAETYTAPGSGKLARHISFQISDIENGVQVQLVAPNYRELGFITDLAGGTFHPGPYMIFSSNSRLLSFFWRRIGARFVGPQVLHPGFSRDVLSEEGHRQMAIWADRMERAVRNSAADILLEL